MTIKTLVESNIRGCITVRIYNKRRAKKWYRSKEYGREKARERAEKGRKYSKEYQSRLCLYNGETLTLKALYMRFMRRGIPNPVIEAKKYLLEKGDRKNEHTETDE